MSVRFDALISSMIAKPATKDGIPLYTRVDGRVDCANGAVAVQANSEYAISSKQVCNSPDNLKRLFITMNGVFVHLHKPVIGRSTSLKREHSYFGEPLHQALDKKMTLWNNGVKFGSHQVQHTGDRELEFVGFGLECLYRPHVYQNIEEIYFDGVVLSNFTTDRGRDFSFFLNSAGGNLEKAITMLFVECCGKGVSNIAERYPRLHTIGFINRLDEIFKRFDEGKESSNFESWFDYALPEDLKQNIKSDGGCIVKVRTGKSWVGNWSVKENIYVFDRDVLKPYAESVKAKYASVINEERKQAIEAEKAELERQLDELMERCGTTYVASLIKVMFYNGEICEHQIKTEFSPNGQKKYLGILSNIVKK